MEALLALGYSGGSMSEDVAALTPGQVDATLRDPRTSRHLIAMMFQATAHFQAGRTKRALDVVQEALAEDPDDPLFLDYAGSFLSRIGRPREALELLEKAVAIEPMLSSSRCTLATCFEKIGEPERAIELHRENLAYDPTFLNSRLLLARLLANEGDAVGAREQYAKLLEHYHKDDAIREEALGALERDQ